MTTQTRSIIMAAAWLACFCGCMLVSTLPATGQTQPWWEKHPELIARLEDGSSFYRINAKGDTVPAEWFSAGYRYSMSTDTTCVTQYTFTGCKKNGTRVPLLYWKKNRVVNLAAELLTYNSRTADFALTAGDTLSFYRELEWRDPRFNRQLLDNYISRDTLTFAVELLRSSDSTRIALLDSMGIMPCAQLCTPTIHGTRPIMAHVHYVAPSSTAPTTAFIRVRVWAGGGGEYFFTREEFPSVALWRRLLDPYWTTYLSQWHAFLKSIPWKGDGANASEAETDARLDVRPVTGTRDRVSIEFDASPQAGPVSVVVYDIIGNELFRPFSTANSAGSYSITHQFAESGTYIVALFHDGKLTRIQKLTISK